jgi:hypothetical protein
LIQVPGDGSSTGNATGGRTFAHHDFCDQPPSLDKTIDIAFAR